MSRSRTAVLAAAGAGRRGLRDGARRRPRRSRASPPSRAPSTTRCRTSGAPASPPPSPSPTTAPPSRVGRVKWAYAGNQKVTSGWNAKISQTGTAVTAANETYNGTLATGGSVSFGFQGTYSGTNADPDRVHPRRRDLQRRRRRRSHRPADPTDPPTDPGTGRKVDNPYAGAKVYVNPEWSAKAAAEPGGSRIANQPTGVWLDRIAAINGASGGWACAPTSTRRSRRRAAASSSSSSSSTTCPAVTAPRSPPTASSARRRSTGTRREYIDPIAAILADPQVRRACGSSPTIEIDSLPNLVTNAGSRPTATPAVRRDEGQRQLRQGRRLRAEQARRRSRTSTTTSTPATTAGSAGTTTSAPSADALQAGGDRRGRDRRRRARLHHQHRQLQRPEGEQLHHQRHRGRQVGPRSPSGSTGTATSTSCPTPRRSATSWSPTGFNSEHRHADRHLPQRLGRHRPAHRPGRHDHVDTYVDGGRIDRRIHAGNWCNQSGAGLGERPKAAPAAGIDAYVWMKPPGESDGSSTAIPNDEGKGFDRMCDPTYTRQPAQQQQHVRRAAERAAVRALVLRPVPAAHAERVPAALNPPSARRAPPPGSGQCSSGQAPADRDLHRASSRRPARSSSYGAAGISGGWAMKRGRVPWWGWAAWTRKGWQR